MPLLLAAAAAPLLPSAVAFLLLALLLGLWMRRRAGGGERLVALLLAAAAALYAADAVAGLARPGSQDRLAEMTRRFDRLWEDLESAAGDAAGRIELGEADAFPLAAFQRLRQLADSAPAGTSYLLLDPDGATVAWAGEGLLHEISGPGTPPAGRLFAAGATSVSLAAVRPLEEGSRPWRAVTGRSFSAERLPFATGGVREIPWTVFGAGEELPAGLVRFGSAAPFGAFRRGALAAAVSSEPPPSGYREPAAIALGLGLLVAAVLAWLLGVTARRVDVGPPLALLLGALLALGVAYDLPARRSLGLAFALVFAILAWTRQGPRSRGLPPPVAGVAAALAPVAAAFGLQATAGAIDLASGVLVDAEGVALRLTVFAIAVGALGLTGGRATSVDGDWQAWLGLALLCGGAALVDRPMAGVVPLAAAGWVSARWLARTRTRRRPSAVALLLLAAALLSAGAWELAYRQKLRWRLDDLLTQAAPPTPAEREEIARRTWHFFRGFDLGRVALRDPQRLDIQDLALAVWKASPLPTRSSLSAVVVESWDGRRSSFSFGLPLDESGDLDRSPLRGQRLPPPELLGDALVEGAEALELEGRSWGFVRYWIVLRPGFRVAHERLEDLARGLLRGGPDPLQPPRGIFEPARLAIYPGGEQVPLAPWADGPARQELAPGARVRITTPSGPALAVAREQGDALRALVLPLLGPATAVERVATHAFGLLPVGALLALVALLLGLPAAVAAVRQAYRSYSRRLLLVAGGFVLVPILALNLLLVRILGERLEREQRAAGRMALESSGRILGEYALSLEPGFGIETALDDELLVWLSRVARHEVNLYWGSSVYASSRRELFTAGLLPERIPGEIYSRLALRGARFAARTNRAGGADYLELYQPVTAPGVQTERLRLVASMPLLAQQEELAEEIARLHRRAYLATAALMLLLAAVGSRLAHGFTKPLMEVVEGTQRIASGARSIELRPTELELATLVEAIDRMAERIAQGRQELVREKELIERMIDNITSAVVSLDRELRVVMANRVAQRLLAARVGESLTEVLAAAERLGPVADFLAASGSEARQRTVRLTSPEGDEREWTLVWAPLAGAGEPSALLVVEDVTEVLRGQRLQAWAEMARIIAHEIKNPLTPIRLSAEHMRAMRVTAPEEFDAVFERCTRNILAQVEELQQISSEFLTYSRIPRCEPVAGDLAALVKQVAEAYRAAPPAGTTIEVRLEVERLAAAFDPKLLGRALRNLLENALRATAGGGRVTIGLARQGEAARIEVADDGPGVPESDLPRIFDPYFSTHDAGTGLGLPIARRIAEEHGGAVKAANGADGGLVVTILLPLSGRDGPSPSMR